MQKSNAKPTAIPKANPAVKAIAKVPAKSGRGGARIGAGRKSVADRKNSHSIRTTDTQWSTFQLNGGNAWLCMLLDSLEPVAKKARKRNA